MKKLNREEVSYKLNQIFEEYTNLSIDSIDLDKDITSQYLLDSLNIIELILAIENKFEIVLSTSDDNIIANMSMNELCDFITNKVEYFHS